MLAGIVYSYITLIPNLGHGGDEYFVHVNGKDISLQEAIDSRYLLNPIAGGGNFTSQNSGHNGNEILVSVSGNEQSLQEAINSGSLCSSGTNSYTESRPNPGHFGSEIIVSVSGNEKTLQNAIDSGDFCFATSYTYGPILVYINGTNKYYANASIIKNENNKWVGRAQVFLNGALTVRCDSGDVIKDTPAEIGGMPTGCGVSGLILNSTHVIGYKAELVNVKKHSLPALRINYALGVVGVGITNNCSLIVKDEPLSDGILYATGQTCTDLYK